MNDILSDGLQARRVTDTLCELPLNSCAGASWANPSVLELRAFAKAKKPIVAVPARAFPVEGEHEPGLAPFLWTPLLVATVISAYSSSSSVSILSYSAGLL